MTSTMAIAIHANRNFSFHSAFPCVCRRSECCLAAAVVVAPLHRMYQFTWLARRHQKPFTVMDCSIAWNWSSFVVRIAQWPITTQQTKWPTTKLFCAQFILFASHLSDSSVGVRFLGFRWHWKIIASRFFAYRVSTLAPHTTNPQASSLDKWYSWWLNFWFHFALVFPFYIIIFLHDKMRCIYILLINRCEFSVFRLFSRSFGDCVLEIVPIHWRRALADVNILREHKI